MLHDPQGTYELAKIRHAERHAEALRQRELAHLRARRLAHRQRLRPPAPGRSRRGRLRGVRRTHGRNGARVGPRQSLSRRKIGRGTSFITIIT